MPASRFSLWVVPLVALAGGCQTTAALPDGGSVTSAGASSGTVSGTSGPGTSSTGGSASGGSSSGSSGSSTAARPSTSSGGTTTGGGNPSPFVDGGYVSCFVASAADAGPDGGAGPAAWMCIPGTYFCDSSGNIGNCSQCRTDADCADQDLPTYDPARPHCDRSSGQTGYQGYCQECLDSADCAGNPAGPFCDLDPVFPFGSFAPFEGIGFETCSQLVTDCRLDGGPLCDEVNGFCEQDSGQCGVRSGLCTTDQDCAGLLAQNPFFSEAEPYCVDGDCSPCPTVACTLDGSCSSDADCSGIYPVCEGLDAGTGTCGCDSSDQCADAGLVCFSEGLSYCALPCTNPGFPSCAQYVSILEPICDSDTGFCRNCISDEECRTGRDTGGPTCRPSGQCGCAADSDCHPGERCEPENGGTCEPAVGPCTSISCQDSFCDWDSGDCTVAISCLIDSDCPPAQPFCQSGACIECRANADCFLLGAAQSGDGLSWCCPSLDAGCRFPATCVYGCATSQDCVGNLNGSACIENFEDDHICACGSDRDCAGKSSGTRCVTDAGDEYYGGCACATSSDCPGGGHCDLFGTFGGCEGCQADSDCPAATFCNPEGVCLPRCDPGHSCGGTETVCDIADVKGFNGVGALGNPSPGAVWCYTCLAESDCPDGQICAGYACGGCDDSAQCAPGETCSQIGAFVYACTPGCDAGACPAGEACDRFDTLGQGVNVCYPCVTAEDCPDGRGCNRLTHTCGSCVGFSQIECPPGDICSNNFSDALTVNEESSTGVCLESCDLRSCPAAQPLCAVLPSITTDHEYCVNCVQDSDCSDLGPGEWCDISVTRTYTCQAAQSLP